MNPSLLLRSIVQIIEDGIVWIMTPLFQVYSDMENAELHGQDKGAKVQQQLIVKFVWPCPYIEKQSHFAKKSFWEKLSQIPACGHVSGALAQVNANLNHLTCHNFPNMLACRAAQDCRALAMPDWPVASRIAQDCSIPPCKFRTVLQVHLEDSMQRVGGGAKRPTGSG